MDYGLDSEQEDFRQAVRQFATKVLAPHYQRDDKTATFRRQQALDLAAMGLIPAGAYRNRDFAQKGVTVRGDVSRTMQDLLYDPQTSGGLLMAVDPADAAACLRELRDSIPAAAQVGYVTEKEENWLILE